MGQPFPKALYHPKHGDYMDHKIVKDEAEMRSVMASDKNWRETPYTDEERAAFKAPKPENEGLPVKPKKSDFKGDPAGFKEAMEAYEKALEELED